ncbi:MAG: hypothetical protein E6X17_02300 [Sporomusaceae bacterium]|nr:hypothetical protein [Sporomusaceae bacterium]
MYIALSDIALSILFCLALAIGLYLILVLRQTLQTVCRIRGIIDGHETALRQSLAQLPELLTNLNALSLSLKQSADLANSTLDSLHSEVAGTVDELRDGLETITLYSRAIGEIIKALFSK